MPRKTKEQKELETIEKQEKSLNKSAKKIAASSAKKNTNVAKTTTSKIPKKDSKATTAKKSSTKKTASIKKETATVKKTATKSTKRVTSTNSKSKVKTVSPSKTKKSTVKSKKSANKKFDIVEYYDLPYRYNQTVVKVLAQTPTNLFIYWDISDADRENYKEQYGDNFFETTKPVLIIHNDSMNYSFEIDINDFANSWYLHVNDAKCDYRVELGRRPISYNEKIQTDYIYVSMSNEIESPNDKILFNKEQKMVYFRNVKTGTQTSKNVSNLAFIRNMGKIYNIYDLYKAIYKDEHIEEIYDLSNPSSGNPSSKNISSQFK